MQHCSCCVVTVITLLFFHCDCLRAEWCPLVQVALGRVLGGKFVLPKDSGVGRLQHVLLSCAVTVLTLLGLALQLSSCRFGASLDVAARSFG